MIPYTLTWFRHRVTDKSPSHICHTIRHTSKHLFINKLKTTVTDVTDFYEKNFFCRSQLCCGSWLITMTKIKLPHLFPLGNGSRLWRKYHSYTNYFSLIRQIRLGISFFFYLTQGFIGAAVQFEFKNINILRSPEIWHLSMKWFRLPIKMKPLYTSTWREHLRFLWIIWDRTDFRQDFMRTGMTVCVWAKMESPRLLHCSFIMQWRF